MAKYWGSHGPPGLPSNYLPVKVRVLFEIILRWKILQVISLLLEIAFNCENMVYKICY